MTSILSMIAILTAAPVLCQNDEEWRFDVRGRGWYAQTGGSIQADGATPGSRLNLRSTLELDDRELSPDVEFVAHSPGFGSFIGEWWRFASSADETLTTDITFRGRTFVTGAPLHSSIRVDVGAATYELPIAHLSLGGAGRLELAVQGGARAFWAEGALRSPGEDATARGFAITPVLGGHVAWLVRPWLRVDADASGMKLSLSSDRFSYLETKGEVTARPFKWLSAGIGYKYVLLDAHITRSVTTTYDLDLAGPYLTVGIEF